MDFFRNLLRSATSTTTTPDESTTTKSPITASSNTTYSPTSALPSMELASPHQEQMDAHDSSSNSNYGQLSDGPTLSENRQQRPMNQPNIVPVSAQPTISSSTSSTPLSYEFGSNDAATMDSELNPYKPARLAKVTPVEKTTTPASSSSKPHQTTFASHVDPAPLLTSAHTPSTSSVATSSISTTTTSSTSSSTSNPAASVEDRSWEWLSLLRIRECFVYAVPKRVGLTPYQAESWGLDKPIFTGELHIYARESVLVIRLIDPKTHTLFAQSVELNCQECGRSMPLEAFLEPVRDSSRYFVIRVRAPNGELASLGLGFRERVSAFDLNASLQDRCRTVQRHSLGSDPSLTNFLTTKSPEDEAKEIAAAEERLAQHHQDFSLKQGERIRVNLKSSSSSKSSTATPFQAPGGPSIPSKPKKKSKHSSLSGQPISLIAGADGRFLLQPPPPALTADSSVQPDGTDGTMTTPMTTAAPTNLSPNHSPIAAAVEPPDFDLESYPSHEGAGEQAEQQIEGQLNPHVVSHPPPSSDASSANSPPNDEEDEFEEFTSAH